MAIDRILARLTQLIEQGATVLGTEYSPSSSNRMVHISSNRIVEQIPFYEWRTSSLAFLNTFPKDYVYLNEFEEKCKFARAEDAKRGFSILMSAKNDIESGCLQKVESLVSASVFSDFLVMGVNLLENGYKDPAASLIGAVLEDGLRRICDNNDIIVKADDNISSLNKKLADNEKYNRLQQREIEVWNKLRDYADHGKFNEYDVEKVKNVLSGIRTFLSNYL